MVEKISVSVMCGDYKKLGEQLEKINDFTDEYHFDFMDGHYVPNITLNFDMIKSLREVASKPINVHLMVTNPEDYIERLINLGVDSISFHLDTIRNQAFRVINEVKDNDIKAGIVLNPAEREVSLQYLFDVIDRVTVMTVDPGFAGQKFIPQMLSKIKNLKSIREENNYNYEIEVDGSVNQGTIDQLIAAGVDIYILGNSGFFSLGANLDEAIENTKKYICFK
ncbi:D-allulose 6-phosphate 3-epimerase [Halocella sp. SP3-1]|uniref:D-allulose 6-phosphate 3-epimerase n=1 Tax=Halocella sp. SP3-1 TaxID=2382161 RepID=UPI000F759A12|nr:D-allulose 6-phosphate 3-epimerase [Halocella sp. SP3-1]AZO93755.1 ribulose-phosphate 3-epimerase [Halocella sp. SP3-1]MTI58982.1 ribulose-phosphate 3-epimerase [Bacillota bacterium]